MARLFNLFRRRRERLEHDLERELLDHVERRVADLAASGLSEAEARRLAQLELGGLTQVREEVRETWTWRWLDAVRLDVGHTLRSLRRSPAFTVGIGAVLTIAIAANVGLFTVVNAVLLQPLPYPDADRLVTIETKWNTSGRLSEDVSGPDFLDWQSQSDVFDAMAVWYGEDDVATVVGDAAVFANDRYVSPDFFAVFGQTAATGRLLSVSDLPAEGADPQVAVVAHDWATTHFGSAASAIDRTVTVYGLRLRIVGVATKGFRYPGSADLWVPWRTTDGGTNRNVFNYQAVGKLKPGVNLASAGAQMDTIARRLAAQHKDNQDRGVALIPLHHRVTGHLRSTLWTLMGAAALVLLIACANVANLQLARTGRRSREFALRAALGAGRRRVTQQLMVEAIVLLVAVTFAGVMLASLLVRLFETTAPAALTGASLAIDPTVVLFIAGLFSVAVLVFGATSVRAASRASLVTTLGAGGGRSVASAGHPRLRSALVVVEVALSTVLLVGAGLLLRSFVSLQHVHLGFETRGVLVAYTQYVASDEASRRQRTMFYTGAIDRLARQPGVEAAAGVTLLPMGRELRPAREFFVRGRPEGVAGQRPMTEVYGITPAYFETLGIPLRQGRAFAATDTADQPQVAVVNESLARTIFPDGRALGEHLRFGTRGTWLQIVGVVGDTRWQSPDVAPPSMIYVPSAQGFGGSLSLVVRSSLDQSVMQGTVQALLREAKPDMPVRVDSMADLFASALSQPRLRVQVTGAFAIAAALLAAIGIFSVLAHLVSLRTREIAVRRVVGANTTDIVRLIVFQGVRLVGLGLTIGLAIAAGSARLMQSVLHDVSPWDMPVYFAVTAILGLSAAMAILLPTVRAAAIAPVIALAQE